MPVSYGVATQTSHRRGGRSKSWHAASRPEAKGGCATATEWSATADITSVKASKMTEQRVPTAPSINPENAPFFEGTKANKLLIKRCTECQEFHYYPRTKCPHCHSMKTEWHEASGNGEIYALSIMRAAPVPYAIGYVTLEEGVRVLTNFVDADVDSLSIGQKVKAVFRKTDGEPFVALFAPA